MTNSRIFVDLRNKDGSGRPLLISPRTLSDLAAHGIALREGLPLNFYVEHLGDDGKRDDLLLTGIARFNQKEGVWVAELSEATARYESELRGERRVRLNLEGRPRIWIDFQDVDDRRRLRLSNRGTKEDLERHGIQLVEGLKLIFYDRDSNPKGERDDLLVEGVVKRDEGSGTWVAVIDWLKIRNESEVTFAGDSDRVD